MCDSCEVLNINGVNCHEHGCPDAWKESTRECAWCGCEYKPDVSFQKVCSDECANDYYR